MEKLNDIYNNINNTDNDIIIRILNTIVEKSKSPQEYYGNFIYFKELLIVLQLNSDNIRNDIAYVISKMNECNEITFDEFVVILKQILQEDKTQYKYLWLQCYLRSIFDVFYVDRIFYKNPECAVKITLGEESFNVFLNSLENNEYVFF